MWSIKKRDLKKSHLYVTKDSTAKFPPKPRPNSYYVVQVAVAEISKESNVIQQVVYYARPMDVSTFAMHFSPNKYYIYFINRRDPFIVSRQMKWIMMGVPMMTRTC